MAWRVVIANRPPFAFKSPDTSRTGNAAWFGYLVDLLPAVLQQAGLNSTLALYEAPENAGGSLVNGTWTGIMGELTYGHADIAAFPLSVTASRLDVIDMTWSYYDAGIGLLVSREMKDPTSWLFFLKPFSLHLWLSLIATVIVVALILTLLSSVSPFGAYDVKRVKRVQSEGSGRGDGGRYAIESERENYLMDLLLAVVLNPPMPRTRSWGSRALHFCFYFMFVIVVSAYTANLASFLTVQKATVMIASLSDLVKSGLKFAINGGGATEAYFATTLDAVAQMLTPRKVFEGTPDDGVASVRQGLVGAFVTDQPTLQFYAQQLPCDVVTVGMPFGPGNYAFGLPRSSPLTPVLSKAILTLRGDGILDGLLRKWMQDLSQCDGNSLMVGAGELKVQQFGGLWVMLGVCSGVALLWAIGERVVVRVMSSSPALRRYHQFARRWVKGFGETKLVWLGRTFSMRSPRGGHLERAPSSGNLRRIQEEEFAQRKDYDLKDYQGNAYKGPDTQAGLDAKESCDGLKDAEVAAIDIEEK